MGTAREALGTPAVEARREERLDRAPEKESRFERLTARGPARRYQRLHSEPVEAMRQERTEYCESWTQAPPRVVDERTTACSRVRAA